MRQLTYVSYIKIWAMIIVVFYHCLCGYSNIWGEEYSWQTVPTWYHLSHILVYFHMPIFTLMSAYLYGYLSSSGRYQNSYSFICKKTKRLLIPYIVWGLLICIIQKWDLAYLLCGISHLWYLFFLFEAFIIFHFINRISHWSKYILFISLYSACCIINYYDPTPFMGIGYFVRYMPYFIIGYYIYFILERDIIKQKVASYAAIACSLLFALEYVLDNNKFILAGLSLIIIICITVLSKQNETQLVGRKIILKLDKYAMGIYIIHHIIIQETNSSTLGQQYMEHYILYPIVLFIMSLGISWLITYILQKSKLGNIIIGS